MHSFQQLVNIYAQKFNRQHFPAEPFNLYEPADYFLSIGGKRMRPVACLMANELFGDISENTWHAADALELFHNFTLLHDDVMDNSALRRGKQTVHVRNNMNTAILSGDAMLIGAYASLNKIEASCLQQVLTIFNKTAFEVCEGQQYDMDFESRTDVSLDEYLRMITLKTSVLLASSLQIGALLGGASKYNADHLYEYGKNLGIAFQLQDDYLDCYGNVEKFGKEIGGDIKRNKKTFLLIKALETAEGETREKLKAHLSSKDENKVAKVLDVFDECGVKQWAEDLKKQYAAKALSHLEKVVVTADRKKQLYDFADYLLQRDY